MIRLDTSGRDVTDSPGLWSEDDCEIVATNFPHPSITEGQHTNGPAMIWIQWPAGEGVWFPTGSTSMHQVREMWIRGGIYAFDQEEEIEQ